MSKKVKRGGMVQISGMHYIATEAPVRDGNRYLLSLFSPAHHKAYLAEAEGWRGGCGPWKIIESPVRLPRKRGEPMGLDEDGICQEHGAFGCKTCVAALEAHTLTSQPRGSAVE